MNNLNKIISILLFFVFSTIVGCSQSSDGGGETAQQAKKVLLKTPTAFNSSLPILGSTIAYVSDIVNEMTDGNIEIKIYQPNELVAPFEILDAVSTGKAQAGYATPGYWTGKMPASALFSAIPFGPEAGEYLAWLYYGDGMTLYQRMYDESGFNVKVLQCGITAPETSGWFTKKIEKPEDLKGLKIRFFGLGGNVMEKLGAAVQLLPGGEIFPALEKKTLDASEFSMPIVDSSLGFYKVAKYNYFPGWHQQATSFELLVNKDVWNDMANSQKKILEIACEAGTANAFAQGEAIQFPEMEKNVKERGVNNVYWSDKMLETYKKAWDEVAKEQSDADPFFKEVYDNLTEFRKGYALWSKYAFLPRER